MRDPARYIYGLARATPPPRSTRGGIECHGRPARVHTVSFEGVCAIVSDVPAQQRLRALRRNLQAHYAVINECNATGAVIPFSFGQIAGSERAVLQVLEMNRHAIEDELERLDGFTEVGLRISWNVSNIFEYVASQDPALATYRDQVFGRSSEPDWAEKLVLGSQFADSLSALRQAQATVFLPRLEEFAEKSALLPVEEEKTIARAVFLVRRDILQRFEEEIREFERAHGHCEFECSGSRPPFHFHALDLCAWDEASARG